MRPSRLLLRTAGVCEFDPAHLVEVFGEQRNRFVAVLQGFRPDDWLAPTRCTRWTAHDIVLHLCDCNSQATGKDPGILDVRDGYDPRVTPALRLAAFAGEPPAATLDRLTTTTADLLDLVRDRLTHHHRFDVRLPYGRMDWTVLLLHAFWDSWLHERDVVLARGMDHGTSDDATFYATAYGVFLAAAVAPLFGDHVQQKMGLGGGGGGEFDVNTSDGVVTLRATRAAGSGSPAAEVTDALAGRAPVAPVLCDVPGPAVAALSRLASYFNTPVH
jgi:uncharacterized protein (TIGR03083 family)